MISSKVAHQKINAKSKEDVLNAVKQVMDQAMWKKHIKGRKIFIKLNCLSDQVVPGQCTSPWVFEGVLKVLSENMNSKIYAGDADVATQRQLETCARKWGFREICEKYGTEFVNLSKEKTKKVNLNGKIFSELDIPKILLDVDSIITIPVLKTHNVTTMTFSLKNQWGCLPRIRQQYHLKADFAIPEINKFLGVKFAVGDATVCLEGNGPRVGIPKIVNSVLASNDLVALDCVGAKIIGINPNDVGHIRNAEKLGVGRTTYIVLGTTLKNERFSPALIENHPIVKWEMRLRKIPIIRYLLFKTPIFKIPAFFASRYNSLWWYNLEGKRLARELVAKSALYNEEFGKKIL